MRSIFAPVQFKSSDSILEFGCGPGTVLNFLLRSGCQIGSYEGSDYSQSLVESARANLPEYRFQVVDVTDTRSFTQPGSLKSHSFDIVMAIGVFVYFDSEAHAERALDLMTRMMKDDGQLIVGEQSDLDKIDKAESLRSETHADNQKVVAADVYHLYLPKSFFINYGNAHNLQVTIQDHSDFAGDVGASASYRYSVYMRKK